MITDKISVLMGVYNCESTLIQAIESIQNQTYTNWELVICDDGSSDHTYEIAIRLAKEDARLLVIKNNHNLGLNKTLNRCLTYATGKYIARMDGDDICVPERFEKQIAFLNSQKDFAICSSGVFFFDGNGKWDEKKAIRMPEPKDLINGTPIAHAPVMMRKECLENVNGYSEDKRTLRVEDVDLWIRLYSAGYRCYNLPEPLYGIRDDMNALKRRKYKYRINSTFVRLRGCKLLGLPINCYIRAFRPMLVGLIPAQIRYKIKRMRK